jgi:thymidylate synthase ThyX
MSTPLNETDVYAIHGADPEVLAYAMAKYSRSALTLRESLAEISSQKAEQFLNTFYFQYGHRSIADLAHVAFAIERLSLLAAISLVDEQRWDGQERSTRYQNFRKSGWYTPTFDTAEQQAAYTKTIESLFDGYTEIGEGMLTELKAHAPRPEGMDEGAYTRTLRARAYDMARYLLPLATNTSLGQITNARTLENQIARLLGSDYAEIRALGDKLRDAASGPAWQVNEAACSDLVQAIRELEPEIAQTADELIRREVRVSPTLVKYTTPSEFERATKPLLEQAAAELLAGAIIEAMPVDSPNVELITPPTGETLSLEIDLAASLLYPHTHYRFRQIRDAVASLSEQRISEIIDLGLQHRGRHDELPRAFAAANGLRFDILMDIGGFRDMHRHRRCTQLLQPYITAHGYEVPDFPSQPALSASPVFARYTELMQQAFAFHAQATGIPANATAASASPKLAAHSPAAVPLPHFDDKGIQMKWGADASETATAAKHHKSNPHAADYVLPLATRCRSLFTMDFAEALYISELRSTPAGHWSYRNVAWQMYSEVAKQYPTLAKHFRIHDPHEPIDLLVR